MTTDASAAIGGDHNLPNLFGAFFGIEFLKGLFLARFYKVLQTASGSALLHAKTLSGVY